jgi:predicted small secreted protein
MTKRILVPLLAALSFAGFFGTLAACSTMDGLGQDIQHGGRAISSEAREHKN